MGNDGGSIPKRRELVKEAARAPSASVLKASAHESLAHAWAHDPVSAEPLDLDAAVSDWRGRLYNYETVLRGLLPLSLAATGAEDGEAATPGGGGGGGGMESGTVDDEDKNKNDTTLLESANNVSSELTFAATGIRSLRDVVRLKFSRVDEAGGGDGGGDGDDHDGRDGSRGRNTTGNNNNSNNNNNNNNDWTALYACPLSLKELGPTTKCVYLVPCGHVFAEAAIRQVQETACPVCSEPTRLPRDAVPILATGEAAVALLAARRDELRAAGLTHGLKKDRAAAAAARGGEKRRDKVKNKNSKNSKKRKALAEGGGEEGGREDGLPAREEGRGPKAGEEGMDDDKRRKDGQGRAKEKIINTQQTGNGAETGGNINNPMTAALTARVLAEQEERNKRRRLAGAGAARW